MTQLENLRKFATTAASSEEHGSSYLAVASMGWDAGSPTFRDVIAGAGKENRSNPTVDG